MNYGKNFRVILNLSSFFHDHRCVARIFINDSMETIQHLKKKIKSIFEIKNFYLTSENQFLPSREDIRVLSNDEVVWAVPHKRDHRETNHDVQPHIPNGVSSHSKKRHISTEPNTDVSPRKKKKHQHETTGESSYINLPSEQVVKKHKKAKSKKKETKQSPIESHVISRNKSSKKNKDHDNTNNSLILSSQTENQKTEKMMPKIQSHINSCSESRISQNTSESSASLTDSGKNKSRFTGNLTNYKRCAPLATVTNDYLANKKINIVQIDIIKQEEVSIGPKHQLVGDKNISNTDSTGSNATSVDEANKSVGNGFVKSIVKDIETRFSPESIHSNEKEGKYHLQENSEHIETPECKNSKENTFVSNSLSPLQSPLDKIARCHESESQYINSSSPYLEQQTEDTQSQISVANDDMMPKRETEIDMPWTHVVGTEQFNENTDKVGVASYAEHCNKLSYSTNTECNDYCDLSPVVGAVKAVDIKPKPSNITDSELSFKVQRRRPGFLKATRLHSGIGSLLSTLRGDVTSNSNLSDNTQHQMQPEGSPESPKLTIPVISGILEIEDGSTQKILENGDDSMSLTTDGSRNSSTRRKRIRKRKNKVRRNTNESIQPSDQSEDIPLNVSLPKPIVTMAKRSLHIRFDNNRMENDKSVIILSDNEEKISESKKEMFTEEFIQRSPIMLDMVPKLNDIIAFKVLRMDKNYAPQISAYIKGKVKGFNTDDGTVTFEILDGLEQCEEPNGKLSLNFEKTKTEEKLLNVREFQFLWSDLKEARLLYP